MSDDLPLNEQLRQTADHAKEHYDAEGRLYDLEIFVHSYRLAAEVTSDDDPQQLYILSNFATALNMRFNRLGERADLDESITVRQLTDAITPEDSSDKPSQLGNLALSLTRRFYLDGRLEDLNEAIALETRALELTPDGHERKPRRMNNLGISLCTHFVNTGCFDHLTKAIALQTQAIELTHEDHMDKPGQLQSLGLSLEERFDLTGNIEDLEHAILLHTRANALISDSQPDKPQHISHLGLVLLRRFTHLGGEGDAASAIALFERALELTPDGHPGKPSRLRALAMSLYRQYAHNSDPHNLTRAIDLLVRANDLTLDSDVNKPAQLGSLGVVLQSRFEHSGNLEDLAQAIAVLSRAVELTPAGHRDKRGLLHDLANALRMQFENTFEYTYLTKAIECSSQAIALLPNGHPERTSWLRLLGGLYQIRLMSPFAQAEDLKHAMDTFSEAMQHLPSPPDRRFRACGQYMILLTSFSHLLDSAPKNSLLETHEIEMELIPQCVWLGNDVHNRYGTEGLATYGQAVGTAAADAIAAGEYTRAVEWLENGRTLVWSQVLQLRTPIDDLRRLHPELATNFHHVSQALQSAVAPSSQNSLTTVSIDARRMDMQAESPHSYAAQYQKLIAQIRGLEGFENFLRPKTMSQLSNASTAGFVVVINVAQLRCDALILSPGGTITPVPLPALSFDTAEGLQSQLRECLRANHVLNRFRQNYRDRNEDRAGRTTRKGAGDGMYKILADLWRLVVKPILNAIQDLPPATPTKCSANTLPHITWCPTGPLTFLPLHAAGIYPRNTSGTRPETIMDSAVSSYTPTLEALLQPHATATSESSHPPKVLVVSQPATPGCTPIGGTTEEAAIVMSLTEDALVLDDEDGTVDAVLDGMAAHNWVHLACHGMQNRHDPTKSAFALYDGRLTLEALMSKHLPNADLAVLSACQTATGDENLSEEAVHLAAGMLNIGYKSVIGTMWSIFDDSAPVVMGKFYEVMMKQVEAGEELQPAYALHEATKVLREKYGVNDFIRWIPFVHFGL